MRRSRARAWLVAPVLLVAGVQWAASASTPSTGRLVPGRTVSWSGGPLTGLAPGSYLLGQDVCAQACDDFLLDVALGSPPDAAHVRTVDIHLGATGTGLSLLLYPPGAGARDVVVYRSDLARLINPRSGVWRVRVQCESAPCDQTTYTASATAGLAALPQAVAHRAGGIRVGTRPSSVRGHVDDVVGNAYEPTLGVTRDGSIFYQATAPPVAGGSYPVFARLPLVRRSNDGGRSWRDITPSTAGIRDHVGTTDPYLWVDPTTDRVFTNDLDPAAGYCGSMSNSDDRGGTWVAARICGLTDREYIFAGPPRTSTPVGYPNVVYYCASDGGITFDLSTATSCSKSLDGGTTFVRTGAPAFNDPLDPSVDGNFLIPGHCSGASGNGVAGPDGTVFLARGWCGYPWIARSRDEGLTWERIQVAHTGMTSDWSGSRDFMARIAADRSGNLYVVWIGANRLPYLATSRDAGSHWSRPMMVAPPTVNEATLVTVAVGAPGKVAIAYLGTTSSPGGPLFPNAQPGCRPADQALACITNYQAYYAGSLSFPEYDRTTWNGYLTESTNLFSTKALFLSGTVNDPADPLVRGPCGPIGCQEAYDFLDVIVGPDGVARAAYVDGCAGTSCYLGVDAGVGIVGTLRGAPSLR